MLWKGVSENEIQQRPKRMPMIMNQLKDMSMEQEVVMVSFESGFRI